MKSPIENWIDKQSILNDLRQKFEEHIAKFMESQGRVNDLQERINDSQEKTNSNQRFVNCLLGLGFLGFAIVIFQLIRKVFP